MNYQARATAFWVWFNGQEHVFRTAIQNAQYAIVNDALKEKLQPLLPDVVFEISHQGNQYMMEFMSMGNSLNRIMTLSLLLHRPPSLTHWTFHHYRTAKMGVMKYHDECIDAYDILVIPVFDKKHNRFKLKVKADILKLLKEEEKFQVFYLLLYEYIGEILCETLIEEVEFIYNLSYQLRYKKQEQIPLTGLRQWLCEQVGEQNVQQMEQQGLIYETFRGKPNPIEKQPRYDIVSGYSGCIELCLEYYHHDKPFVKYLREQGLQVMYAYIETLDKDVLRKILLHFQKAIDRHGMIIGVSEALTGAYIDFLSFDQFEFIALIKNSYSDISIQRYEF